MKKAKAVSDTKGSQPANGAERIVMGVHVHKATLTAAKILAAKQGTTVSLVAQEAIAQKLADYGEPIPPVLRKELKDHGRPVPTHKPAAPKPG